MKSKIMMRLCVVVGMLAVCSMAGTMKDSRDGQTYKTVKIGDQVWMAENLNYKTSGSACYENNPANCKKYGALYTWESAKNACPAGWHLPNDDEWITLLEVVGGSAGKKLKSKSEWSNGGNSTDSFGFTVLPAGFLADNGYFNGMGLAAFLWSSTENNRDAANVWAFAYNNDNIHRIANSKLGELSVRCLQDSRENNEASLSLLLSQVESLQHSQVQSTGATTGQNTSTGTIKDVRDGKMYKIVKIGNQTWMAENLNYKTKDSYCYNDDDSKCKKYGRLYTWDAAKNACPDGWHLPHDREWKTLLDAVGESVEKKLKSKSGWSDGGNGTDSFGFTVLPTGIRVHNGNFGGEGYVADFWSSEYNSDSAYDLNFLYNLDYVGHNYNFKNFGFSVRCVQNSN